VAGVVRHTPGRVRGTVPLSCQQCGATFLVTARRAATAKYCSIVCRDAGKRVTKACQVCDAPMSLKRSEADKRLFCSRTCMQVAWACAFCAQIRPVGRRDQEHCSERCSTLHHLDRMGDETGERRAMCGRCQRILPADAFHKEKCNRNGLSNRCKECTRDYYQRSKGKYRERRYRYQAAEGGKMVPFTAEQRAARFSMWGGRCWVCGIAGATQEDHVKPISKAGWHCLANLRPICHGCNSRKQGRWPLGEGWLRANFKHPNPRPGNDADERRPREPRVDFTCPVCDETTVLRASDARTRKACSKACGDALRTLPLVALICRGCGQSFEVHHSTRKIRLYCSHRCFTSSRRGTGSRSVDPDHPALF
jgi:5-methylcytosine-specific restriction endonuclease McrA